MLARWPTRFRLLAATAATGATACSLNLDYLDADGSITDAAANAADRTSSDSAADVDHSADANGPDVDDPAEGGGLDAASALDVANGLDDASSDVADAGPGGPALLPDAATVTCPSSIGDSLGSSDGTQTGRISRVPPNSACGTTKGFPTTNADPTNPHIYRAYRFANTTAAPSCYTFVLTYGATSSLDAGMSADASMLNDASVAPAKYMTAYSTFYPADLAAGYLGDVGAQLISPQTMGITVPAGGTIDVVVHAVDVAPAGLGPYTLSCTAQ
jgi:hypothetical protein